MVRLFLIQKFILQQGHSVSITLNTYNGCLPIINLISWAVIPYAQQVK
ncbi:hypothetical protein [Hydrotalea sandarakina]|nr:hypothetical protein [Hydrotalea sandarakina]